MKGVFRYVFFFTFVFFLGLSLLSFALAAPPRGACPIQSDTTVVVYGDTGSGGVGVPSRSWMTHFLNWWTSYDSRIHYVFLDRNDVKSDCDLSAYPNVTLYIQPGGNAYYQQNSLGSAGRANILRYLDTTNGAYLGVCAGAFYAANDYYWQGEHYNWPNLLKRFPTVEGSITSIADYDESPGYALTTTESLGRTFNMIYYGGPTRGWRDTSSSSPGEQPLTFTGIPGGLPAGIRHEKMLLMSVHAEAYEGDGISGLTTEQRIENYKWLANEINDVAGTDYVVPPYTVLEPSACSDGLDNDADGLVDWPSDPGCTGGSDTSEVDSTGPVVLFADDFESGALAGWSLSRASGANLWVSSVTNPFQGIRHAESKPQSTSDPASVMEIGVSTAGASSVSVSYARKLVGLDSADEFRAKWFNGVSWFALEQTGSSSANDASYVQKTFVLPASAGDNANFKLRFECTAGAVSEFCRVDNVQIIGA